MVGFHNEGVKIGDKDMTKNIVRTKVALVVTILLVTIICGQTSIDVGMITVSCEVSNQSMISQTYTDHAAIIIDGNADFLSQAAAESWAGTGLEGSPIVIEGYRITDSLFEGIKIDNVDLHWAVRECLIEQSGSSYACGFAIANCSNGEFANNIVQNRAVAVRAIEGNYNCSFTNNQLLTNIDTTFKVIGGLGNCIISGNNFSGNAVNNIWITGGFNDSQIVDNTIRGGHNGIRVTVCLRSSITGNTISDCGLDALVFPGSIGVVVTDNFVRNTTGCGIMLSGSLAEIESNTVIDSTAIGIYIASGDDGVVSNNLVVNSSEYGLKLGAPTTNTSVTVNSFINNVGVSSQILDDGENNDISYNHYSDWITPDEDMNGIVDVAYSLDGEASNSDPFPIVDVSGRIPTITTTTVGALSIDSVLIAGIGIGVVALIIVIFFVKRR